MCSCALLKTKTRRTKAPEVRNVEYKARNSMGNELRKRILILPFLDEKLNRSKKVAQSARKTLIKQLNKGRYFVIIKPSDLPKNLKTFLTDANEYDLEALANMTKSLGISAVVEGKIIEIKAKRVGAEVGVFRSLKAQVEAVIRVRVVSAKTGRIILNDTRSSSLEANTTRFLEYSYSDRNLEEDPRLIQAVTRRAFNAALRSLVLAIDKLSWSGLVALVSGERIYVNAGRLSGIQIGDVLKVLDKGEEVFDPESGNFIGNAHGRMKGTLEVVSYFGKDGSIGIIHSGSGFKENDQVELY